MSKLKLFFHCCCQFSNENEEQKTPMSHYVNSMIDQKVENNNLLQAQSSNLEESSIKAAPSPLMDGSDVLVPRLKIKIIESTSAPIGRVLSISPTGMEDSKRGKFDFKTYIGCVFMENGQVLNDFVIEEGPKGMGKQHLLIKYSATKQKYLISDLGDGSGTFVKIQSPLVLKDGYIVSFGNSHMTIHYSDLNRILTVKFLEGPKSNEVYNFSPGEDTILVGRMVDCRIRFDDNSMSRYQCSIHYDDNKGWILFDGVHDKKSTNGTWLFVEDEYEIFHGMVFKAGKTLFEVSVEH